jgi:hypothetical protein
MKVGESTPKAAGTKDSFAVAPASIDIEQSKKKVWAATGGESPGDWRVVGAIDYW